MEASFTRMLPFPTEEGLQLETEIDEVQGLQACSLFLLHQVFR